MKAFILLTLSVLTASVFAQKPVADTRRTVTRAQVVPESARAARGLRSSTAQAAAARVNNPLMPALPEFSVQTRAGLAVSSRSLYQNAHWFLLYRPGNCLPCDRLMKVLGAGSGVAAGKSQAYTFLVADKDTASLDRVHSAFPELVNAVWVADATGASTAALKVHSAPVLYAMQGNTVAWSVAGNLGNPDLLEHKATAWLLASTPSAKAAPSTATSSTTSTSSSSH
jgi:hypothetical protein